MPSITNVNDLPQEVHKAFFDNFNPVERTLILSTCRRWYDLIMETRAYWREVEAVEGDSKEKMMRILQVFGQRSQGSLVKVLINREIETKEELQEVLSSIEPSIGSIKGLAIRQQFHHLNTQTRTFARRMPQLQYLYTRDSPLEFDSLLPGVGFRSLETDSLEDLEQEEVEWLSQLKFLKVVYIGSGRVLWSVLSSCKASLAQLVLCIQAGQELRSREPIVLESLESLSIVSSNISAPTLPLITPALKALRCMIPQAEVTESPSLQIMNLTLEDEDSEDEDWEEDFDQEDADEWTERLESVLQQKSDLSLLVLRGRSPNFQLQYQCILQTLLISDENNKEVLLPNLFKLEIKDFEDDLDLKALASLAISRIKYFFNENSLNKNSLRARGIKIDMKTLDETGRHLIPRIFQVELDPLDPNLKNEMMEQYLKMKESMYEDWIKELKLRGSGSKLEGK